MAELVLELAEMGFHGACVLPAAIGAAGQLLIAVQDRHTRAVQRIKEVVNSCTSDTEMRLEMLNVMVR